MGRTNVAKLAIPWSLRPRRGDEACRWECIDGRWVTIALDVAADHGHAVVLASDGRRAVADSFEGALELAKSWRTWD
jgi:hypothetical protein